MTIKRREFAVLAAGAGGTGAATDDHAAHVASGGGLAAALLRRKYSEEALRRCGLFFIYDDAVVSLHSLRPRFRGRLMVPIHDRQGRVIGFGGRSLDGARRIRIG